MRIGGSCTSSESLTGRYILLFQTSYSGFTSQNKSILASKLKLNAFPAGYPARKSLAKQNQLADED